MEKTLIVMAAAMMAMTFASCEVEYENEWNIVNEASGEYTLVLAGDYFDHLPGDTSNRYYFWPELQSVGNLYGSMSFSDAASAERYIKAHMLGDSVQLIRGKQVVRTWHPADSLDATSPYCFTSSHYAYHDYSPRSSHGRDIVCCHTWTVTDEMFE